MGGVLRDPPNLNLILVELTRHNPVPSMADHADPHPDHDLPDHCNLRDVHLPREPNPRGHLPGCHTFGRQPEHRHMSR